MKIDSNIVRNLQAGIQQGRQQDFENLYRLLFPKLHSFSLMYVQSREVAEEIVNDVMVKIWERKEQLMEIENLETYLYISVRNHSLNHIQKFSRIHIRSTDNKEMAEIVTVNDPQSELEWKEMVQKLNLAVSKLPDQSRTVFRLIKEEGFRYKQVAEILGISVRTVETQLYRAVKKLESAMQAAIEKRNNKHSRQNKMLAILFMIGIFLYWSCK